VKDEATITRLVDGIGARKVSLIAGPGSLPPAVLQDLGVARISVGPWSQRVALTALADVGESMLHGGSFPEGIRPLN
jgi:2-methylisocitrate lyase-like PEP mutase family enzyme